MVEIPWKHNVYLHKTNVMGNWTEGETDGFLFYALFFFFFGGKISFTSFMIYGWYYGFNDIYKSAPTCNKKKKIY